MDIGYMLTNISNGTRQKFDSFFSQYDLTYAQYRALMWMFGRPADEQINQNDLCNALCVKPSSISSLIRTLENRGFLATSRRDGDHRNKNLILTQKALEVQAALERARINGEEQLTHGLDPETVEILRRALEQILKNVEAEN